MEKQQLSERKNVLNGVVIRTPGEKTLIVEVVSYKMHPKYRKKYKNTKWYHVHDEENKHAVGENVRFVSSRPRSKKKRFEVIE